MRPIWWLFMTWTCIDLILTSLYMILRIVVFDFQKFILWDLISSILFKVITCHWSSWYWKFLKSSMIYCPWYYWIRPYITQNLNVETFYSINGTRDVPLHVKKERKDNEINKTTEGMKIQKCLDPMTTCCKH